MNFVRSKSQKGINYYSINTISHKVSNLPNLGQIISLRSLVVQRVVVQSERNKITRMLGHDASVWPAVSQNDRSISVYTI